MHANYRKFLITLVLNTILMFFVTFVMIDSLDHFYANINRFYMALMMAAPMGILMLLMMRKMYENRRLNLLLHAAFAAVFIVTFWLARTQTPVGNRQFLRSMIPHHSSAIVMCEQSTLTDPEIVKLCGEIVKTQKEEIAKMQALLAKQ